MVLLQPLKPKGSFPNLIKLKSVIERLKNYERYCDEAFLSEHFKRLMYEANSRVDEITPQEVDLENESIIFLDVREPEEFASGHIPAKKVLAIPRGKLEFMAIENIAKPYGQNAPVVTYCLKGPRGVLAAYQLKKMGFENILNLTGGIRNWLKSGYPIHNYLGTLSLNK